MSLGPGELLGLPPGFPDVVSSVAFLRYLMIALGGLWAVLTAGGRARSLIGGILFVEVGLSFWVLALGRPYGLLVDPDVTRRAAEVAVVVASGSAAETFLAGEPGEGGLWVGLARMGASERLLVLAPTLLPLLVLPALGVLVRVLWGARDLAPLGAALWLAFSTGDLETLRGLGFIPGIWARPEASMTLVPAVALVLALSRGLRWRASWVLVGLLAALAVVGIPTRFEGAMGPVDALLVLSLDQGPWFVLALLGLRRSSGAARALMLAGALLVTTNAFGLRADPWCGHALYRLGLILAACGPVARVARRAGEILGRARPLARIEPLRAGTAAILLLLVPGSFLTWWDPRGLDPVAKASLEPLSRRVSEAMAWIRRQTPPQAVFLASPEYAPSLAVLAGRRVLRAPTLGATVDEERRVRTERLVLAGQAPRSLLERYGLSHVFIAPGDFRSHGLRAPEDLEARGRFRLRYKDADGLRVYEIRVE